MKLNQYIQNLNEIKDSSIIQLLAKTMLGNIEDFVDYVPGNTYVLGDKVFKLNADNNPSFYKCKVANSSSSFIDGEWDVFVAPGSGGGSGGDPSHHIEGTGGIASGVNSHVEGLKNMALTASAHAEGNYTMACSGTIYTILSSNDTAKTFTLDNVTGLAIGDKIQVKKNNNIGFVDISITNISGNVITVNINETLDSDCKYCIKKASVETATHAEGVNCIASGTRSHVEGSTSIASGSASHAEGFGTLASGSNAHSEGNSTKSTGLSSHSEGTRTMASANFSHAEGNTTIASGVASHSEGAGTVASTENSHAKGKYTLACNGTLYTIKAFDNTAKTATLDNVTGIAVNDLLQIKITNRTSLENVKVTAINGLIITLDTIETITADWMYVMKRAATQNPAYAEGQNTTATGDYSHAEGNLTLSSGISSHAEGISSKAFGICSHAEGQNTVSSGANAHTEGWKSIAVTAQEAINIASVDTTNKKVTLVSAPTYMISGDTVGFYSYSTCAYLYANITNITGTTLTLDNAIPVEFNVCILEAVGRMLAITSFDNASKKLTLSDPFGSAAGIYAGINGAITVKIAGIGPKPYNVTAIDDSSKTITLGTTDTITADWKFIVNTSLPMHASHAEGIRGTVFGAGSHVEGFESRVMGYAAHAEGRTTCAANHHCHTEGLYTRTTGQACHAEGTMTFAGSGTAYKITTCDDVAKTVTLESVTGLAVNDRVSLGGSFYNPVVNVIILSITGNVVKLSTTDPLVYNDGSFLYLIKTGTESWWSAHAEGTQNIAIGTGAHSEGSQNLSISDATHSEGWRTRAIYAYAHAEGQSTTASGNAAHAEGISTTASGPGAHSEGTNSAALGWYTHAEGTNGIACPGTLYRILAFDNTAKTLTLNITTGLAVNDVIYVKTGTITYRDVIITAISGYVVTVSSPYTFDATMVWAVKSVPGYSSHAEGNICLAVGDNSHAEGQGSIASSGSSHAEGTSWASQQYAHAEGCSHCDTFCGHSEGAHTLACAGTIYPIVAFDNNAKTITISATTAVFSVGDYIHIFGGDIPCRAVVRTITPGSTTVVTLGMLGGYSLSSSSWYAVRESSTQMGTNSACHAEGYLSAATGIHSHASGLATIAAGACQTVVGVYNAVQGTVNNSNATDLLFIVGGGYSNTDRRNSFTVSRAGDVTSLGKIVSSPAGNQEYTTRQCRNTIISTADPSGGQDGDIWIKYIS